MKNLLPADFDREVYLNLNPDVKNSGADPEIHFLNFGINENRKYKEIVIGVGLIVKDEAPYILEWIAHHMVLGIDKFFIADNSSEDGTKEILAKLNHAGIIKLIHFPGQIGHPPQMPAYSEIIRNSNNVDWLAFIDADEFLTTSPGVNFKDLVSNISKNSKIGAIAINWSIYGSSNQIHKTSGLVMERFKHRSSKAFLSNKHYKSILRIHSLNKILTQPHYFELKSGQNYVHSNGILMMDSVEHGKGLSAQVFWEPLRLNHYMIKSKDEFNIRSKRALASSSRPNPKNDNFFQQHDQNEIFEEIDQSWIKNVKKTVDYLESIPPIDQKPKIEKIESNSGWIDSIQIDRDYLRIKGWSYLLSGSGREDISLLLLDQEIEIISILPIQREDVASKIKGANPFCGFEITCSSKEVTYYELETIKKICLEVKVGDAVEILNLNPEIEKSSLGLTFPNLLREFYIKLALSSKLIIEYGSGSSTFFCAINGIPIISVESDLIFLNHLKSEIDLFSPKNSQVRILHANIGNTKSLGYPEDESSIRLFPQYATLPWKLSLTQDVEPDLVLIDGRFRVACMLATMATVRKPTKVIFDDYTDREYNQIIEQYIKPVAIIDRAAYFEISPRCLSAFNILNHLDSFFDPS